jgi:TolA-binding protein
MLNSNSGGTYDMKKNAIALALAAFLLAALTAWAQTVGVPVEGTVTEEGKPLPNVQVVLTNVDTGRNYKTKTDKNGHFSLLGIPYGNFQVDVLGEKDKKLFTTKTSVGGESGGTSSGNFMKIDVPKGGMPDQPEASGPKLTKEQVAKIEAENKKIAGLNSLISDSQKAMQASDWPKAENALKQLIAAAPESSRWDFYLYLGEAQARQNKYQDAADTFDKGVKAAQPVASGAVPANEKVPALTPTSARAGTVRMLLGESNAYLKLQKSEEAVTAAKKAAELDPSSALAAYNLCGVEYSAAKYDDAKTACNKYLQLEPNGSHADEVKGFLGAMGSSK